VSTEKAMLKMTNQTCGMRQVELHTGDCTRSITADFGLNFFPALPRGKESDLATAYYKLLRAGELAAYEIQERFNEIGSAFGQQSF
jgi:hypothetical protein